MSSSLKNSLIHLRDFKKQQILDIFDQARKNSQNSSESTIQNKSDRVRRTAALIFLEASTRTRLSFETACVRLGLHPLVLDANSGSSLEKGESFEDTILNIAAMKPCLMVIRGDDSIDFTSLDEKLPMPLLNAGWGRQGHPSQALLDAYTIWQKKGALEKQKVLIIGDVRHSRVAASHFELAQTMGYEIALCGPSEFLPSKSQQHIFSSLQEGLAWATVVMSLRVQKERHSSVALAHDYAHQFGINHKSKKFIATDALIMHPGPINHGVEMDTAMTRDPRSVILEQVTNGIYIRQALLQLALAQGDL